MRCGTEIREGRGSLYPGRIEQLLPTALHRFDLVRNDRAGWHVLSSGSLITKGTYMQTTWLKKMAAASLQLGGLALVLAACSGVAWAAGPPIGAPEIDPNSMQAALMLLGGGVMLVADRFRRRSR